MQPRYTVCLINCGALSIEDIILNKDLHFEKLRPGSYYVYDMNEDDFEYASGWGVDSRTMSHTDVTNGYMSAKVWLMPAVPLWG